MKIEKLMPPLLVTMNSPRGDRDELMKLMLPSMLDVEENWRPMLGALLGKQVLQHCRNRERNSAVSLLNEVPGAIEAIIKNDGRLTDEELRKLPTIQRLGLRQAVEAMYARMSPDQAGTNVGKTKAGRGTA